MVRNYGIHIVVLTLLIALGITVFFLQTQKTDVQATPPVISDSNTVGNLDPINNDVKKPDPKVLAKTQEKPDEQSVFDQAELDALQDLLFDRSPDSWKNLDYTRIEDNEDFHEFLNNFNLVYSEIELSHSHRQNLVESLKNQCFAFNKGFFSDFVKFRLPAEYEIRQRATDWQKYFLVNRTDIKEKDVPQDPYEIWKLYWKKRNATDWGFEGLWQAIAVPQVSVKKSSRVPLTLFDEQELLDRPAALFRGSVDFKRKPLDIIGEEGELVYADVEIVISHITGLTYPIVVRSYWDSRVEKWLPYEMIVCYTGRGRKADPDF